MVVIYRFGSVFVINDRNLGLLQEYRERNYHCQKRCQRYDLHFVPLLNGQEDLFTKNRTVCNGVP